MIPKKIHYCWFGGKPLPENAKKCIESWRRFAPDYEIIEWNESNYSYDKNEFMKSAYESKKWSFVTDYARLDIIYNHGGIYMDTDVELIRNIDELLVSKAYFGFETDETVNTGLGFGAEPGLAILKEMMEIYEELPKLKGDEYDSYVCPFIQTPVLIRHGLRPDGSRQSLGGVEIFPKIYFCPMDYETGRLGTDEKSFSIHWYDGSWMPLHDRKVVLMKQKLTPVFGKKTAGHLAVLIQYPRYLGIKKTLKYYGSRFKR